MSIPIRHIKLERCECGGTPTEEAVNFWGYSETRAFSCGRRLVLRGGNETNYSVEEFKTCGRSAAAAAQKVAIEGLLSALLEVCDKHPQVEDAVLTDVKNSIRCSLGWRLR